MKLIFFNYSFMINYWIKYNHFPLIHQFTGCPNASYYGDNCSTPCHQNCLEGRCDVVDGTCLGCILGYTGPTCDIGWNTLFNKENTENTIKMM